MGDGLLYRRIGIRIFKRYLPTSGDIVTRRRGIRRIESGNGGLRAALLRYEKVTRSYERRHIFGALSMLALSWWSITVHGKGNWYVLTLANIIINGYPIMVQRYNRLRINAVLDRLTHTWKS